MKIDNKLVISNTLKRHYVDLEKDFKNYLFDALGKYEEDEKLFDAVSHLIELIADSNYKLGAERQKEALKYNIDKLFD